MHTVLWINQKVYSAEIAINLNYCIFTFSWRYLEYESRFFWKHVTFTWDKFPLSIKVKLSLSKCFQVSRRRDIWDLLLVSSTWIFQRYQPIAFSPKYKVDHFVKMYASKRPMISRSCACTVSSWHGIWEQTANYGKCKLNWCSSAQSILIFYYLSLSNYQ